MSAQTVTLSITGMTCAICTHPGGAGHDHGQHFGGEQQLTPVSGPDQMSRIGTGETNRKCTVRKIDRRTKWKTTVSS